MSPFEQAFQYLQQNRPQGRFMGGSTGARGYDLPMGQFVGKRGDSPQHIQNEYDMNRFLNELGVPVPQAQMQDGLMLTQMEEGQRMGFQPTAGDIRQLTRDFVPHATIANWDMLGLDRDNVIRRPDGTLSYVDVGGAGAFRAQGAPKGGAFGSTVGELDTLRDKNPELAGISEADLGRSYDAYGGEDAMTQALNVLRNPNTRDIMQQRVQDVARRVA
tara:strand:+ start:3862 stop:4512 length:651 start_codon:yes stop_codon:yes gene_type:complete